MTDRLGGNSQSSHGGFTGSKTLGAVARLANVDSSTVSRVLRNDPVVRVRPATRERIIAAAAKLGYVPNVNARSLVLRRTMTLGLIIPSAANVVYDQIIKGAESAARAAGYVLLLTESSDFGRIWSPGLPVRLNPVFDSSQMAARSLAAPSVSPF